jgi:hypothetical protein
MPENPMSPIEQWESRSDDLADIEEDQDEE